MPEGHPQSEEELRRVEEVRGLDLPAGDVGEGLRFKSSRGSFNAILHKAPNTDKAVIWVCGARGGFGGPGPGTYARMSEKFVDENITSLRLDYRYPNDVFECTLDVLAGVAYLKSAEHQPVVVVGHSFGGAVVIAAGANSSHIKGVVALSPQTYGAGMAPQLAPRRLLVVHGKADTRLTFACGQQIYDMAKEPKELVLYEGAEHRLEECRDDLEDLLGDWIPETLAADIKLV
jgi:alpha/beta superfamily hydrolase